MYDYQLTVYLLLPSFLLIMITSVPLLLKKENNVFSPLSYMFYWLFITVFLRMIFIIYDLPDPYFVKNVFMQHNDKLFLVKPLIIMICGMFVFVLGYLLFPYKNIHNINISVIANNWSEKKIYLLSIILTIISLSALIIFITQNIGSIFNLTNENISSYRGISLDLSNYNSSSVLRRFIAISETTYIVLVAYHIQSIKYSKIGMALLVINFAICFFFHFFVQSRAALILLIINPIILNYLYGNRKKFLVRLTGTFFITLILLSFITSYRQGTSLEIATFTIDGISKVFNPLIASNSGVDVSKTGLIIDYIDRNEEFRYGETFSWIFLSFIPRSLWSDKPLSLDTYFGMNVYGAEMYGTGAVPPGIFAELYFNFGLTGVIAGCFLTGILLRKIYLKYLFFKSNNINQMLFYVICFMSIGTNLFGSGISSTIVGLLYQILPLVIFLKFITVKPMLNNRHNP